VAARKENHFEQSPMSCRPFSVFSRILRAARVTCAATRRRGITGCAFISKRSSDGSVESKRFRSQGCFFLYFQML
jgi:hypothetical protein